MPGEVDPIEKLFRDPVHGFVVVDDPLILDLIGTSEVQRLRRIRQLGAAYGTYHGAEHSRFTHSLGAMHVMRRVLAHLHDDGIALEEGERRAALAAALLHDLGHGPFSHLWEQASPSGWGHEEWTRAIIAGDTEVNRVLRQGDPALPERVMAILSGNYPAPFLCRLVSSQLDVDRMDYLLRDALLAGATYGRYDLDRLIHTMAVAEGQLVVASKGLSNVEEYLLARYFMYWRVYFHKTIRGQEVLFKSLMARAADLCRDCGGPAAVPSPPPLVPFLCGVRAEGIGLEAYLSLDDHDVLCAIKSWATGDDPVLRDLASRFLHRRLFKPVFDEAVSDQALARLDDMRALVAARGWDPRYYCAADRTADVAYDYYVSGTDEVAGAAQGRDTALPILILYRNGTLREASAASPLIRSIAERPRAGVNVYVPEDCRDEARALLL